MSEQHGRTLSQLQDELAQMWTAEGPDAVYDYILRLPRITRDELIMVNIGARAIRSQSI